MGAILKNRFPPVTLKYNTWIITDITSITYTKPTISKKIGISNTYAIPMTKPPRANEPVSHIKIFAGKTLNIKNPNKAPIIALATG